MDWDSLKHKTLNSYKYRKDVAKFAGWRAEKRHGLSKQVEEVTQHPDLSYHPVWHALWRERVPVADRYAVERDLLEDALDAVCLSLPVSIDLIADLLHRYQLMTPTLGPYPLSSVITVVLLRGQIWNL